MHYMVCPTCGHFFSQRMIKFEEEKDKICNNPNLSNEEKDELISKLILSLKLRRICCKIRVLTYKDIIKDIIPANNN